MLKWLKRQRTFLESREQSRRRAEIWQGANVKKHLEIPWFRQQQQIEAKENKDLSFQSTLLSLCGLSIVKKRAELLSPFQFYCHATWRNKFHSQGTFVSYTGGPKRTVSLLKD